MKLLTLIFLFYLNSCMGQWPIQKAYKTAKVIRVNDTTFVQIPERLQPDTIPCFLLVCDTQPINGKTDTHVYWVKGYKVVEDFDTYYLDISKKRFGRSVIIWLDQNN